MDARFLNEEDPERSWARFLPECLPVLENAARRASADDEEARDVAAEALGRFRADWPELLRRYAAVRERAEVAFAVWFAVVARNVTIDVLRARHGRRMMPRPVARLEAWKQRLWKLAIVEERSISDARDELVRERVFEGSLVDVATALHEIEAVLTSAPRLPRPRVRARGGDADGAPEPSAPREADPAAAIERRAAHAALRENLAELDAEQRFLLRLYFLEGATAAEVARVCGLQSTNQVYDRVKAILRRLREAAQRHRLGPDDLGRLADFDWARALAEDASR